MSLNSLLSYREGGLVGKTNLKYSRLTGVFSPLRAVEGQLHPNDLHATLLALMGLDHEKLTYRDAGRDFRLTNVAGVVNQQIFA